MQKFKIVKKNNGIRVDHFLKHIFPHIPKGEIQKRLRKKEVKINGKRARFFDILHEGDSVNVYFSIKPKFNILYRDKNVLAVDKPAGVCVVKEDTGQQRVNLESLFPKYYPVHRLDKNTSGVFLMAKNNKILEFLQNQFRKREVKKMYIVLVKGRLVPEKGIINAPVGRKIHNRKKMGVVGIAKKRYALTRYKVQRYFSSRKVSLVDAQILTGRTHQIRVHFKAIGYPVVGDNEYGNKKINREFKNKLGLTRQFLHAKCIGIILPARKYIEIESPLAPDLQKVLGKI